MKLYKCSIIKAAIDNIFEEMVDSTKKIIDKIHQGGLNI